MRAAGHACQEQCQTAREWLVKTGGGPRSMAECTSETMTNTAVTKTCAAAKSSTSLARTFGSMTAVAGVCLGHLQSRVTVAVVGDDVFAAFDAQQLFGSAHFGHGDAGLWQQHCEASGPYWQQPVRAAARLPAITASSTTALIRFRNRCIGKWNTLQECNTAQLAAR